MINKLIDEPYWNELDEVIGQHLGNNKMFLQMQWKDYPFRPLSWNIGVLFSRLLTPQSVCIVNEDQMNAHLEAHPNQGRYFWDSKRLVHYCKKRLPLIKSQLIKDINQESMRLYIWGDDDATDPEASVWNNYIKELSLKNDIHEIFKVYQKITELKGCYYKGTRSELIEELSK